METPPPRRVERAARFVESVLRYLVARPAQLLLLSVLLVCLGAGLAAVFISGNRPPPPPVAPTAVSTTSSSTSGR